MTRTAGILAVLVLAGLAFAGCIGGDDDQVEPASDEPVAEQAVATEEFGAITGQILDNSLEVVTGADVFLVKKADQVAATQTDKEGRYTFNELSPGTYNVQVSAAGYASGARAVDVKANDISDVSMQIDKLSDVELGLPYVDQREFNGFLACGAGQAILPPGNPAYPSGINPRTSPCGTIDENDEFLFEFGLDPGLQQVVIGMTWKPVGGVSGTELNINMERDGCGATCEIEETYFEVSGPPDLLISITEEDIPEELAFSALNETKPVQFRIFPAATQTPNIIYQQPYTIYMELYYNQLAPEGRNPIPDQ